MLCHSETLSVMLIQWLDNIKNILKNEIEIQIRSLRENTSVFSTTRQRLSVSTHFTRRVYMYGLYSLHSNLANRHIEPPASFSTGSHMSLGLGGNIAQRHAFLCNWFVNLYLRTDCFWKSLTISIEGFLLFDMVVGNFILWSNTPAIEIVLPLHSVT